VDAAEDIHIHCLSCAHLIAGWKHFLLPSWGKHEEIRMSEFKRAIANSELDEGSILAVRLNGQRIALYKIGGEVYATSEMCSHSDCSLEDFGKIVEDNQVECICHGARFRIKTGEVTRLPAEIPLKTYSIRIDHDEVWVRVPDPVQS
jgi:3-phenylpropionate/trans-cinnamate dioxygenase ferredoxin subunit